MKKETLQDHTFFVIAEPTSCPVPLPWASVVRIAETRLWALLPPPPNTHHMLDVTKRSRHMG